MSRVDELLRGFRKHCDIKTEPRPAENCGSKKQVALKSREKQQSGPDACSRGHWERGFERNTGGCWFLALCLKVSRCEGLENLTS